MVKRRRDERPAEQCELGTAIRRPDVRVGLYLLCKWGTGGYI